MVKVQPVVCGKHIGHDFIIIHHIVRDFGVGQHQSDGVVPRQLVFWRINCNLRCLGQLDLAHVHIGTEYFSQNPLHLGIGRNLVAHIPRKTFVLNFLTIFT